MIFVTWIHGMFATHTRSFENWSSTQMSASSSSGHIALESHLEFDLVRDYITD